MNKSNQNKSDNSKPRPLAYVWEMLICGAVGVAFVLLFWFGPHLLR